MRLRSISAWGPWLLLAITVFLGWGFKAHCGAFWTAGEQYITGCYSDAVPFWGLRGVAAGQWPYFEARLEYPVLTGALIWAGGLVARVAGGAGADAATFLGAVTALNALLAFAVLDMMESAGVDPARRWAWAGAPPLLLYIGHNWDMLAVALAIAAVLAARRGADVAASALAALGAAAKLFPVLLLPLLGLAAWSRRGLARGLLLAVVAMAAWGAVNLPVAAFAYENWREFYAFSQERSGTAASMWELLSTFGWWQSGLPARNLASFALFAGGAEAIVAAGWRRHEGHVWVLFTPVLAWFLLTNKVYSPQFDLWLYPFLLLTSRRLWPVAWFAAGDIAAYFAEMWWFASLEGIGPGATPADIATVAVFRGAAMLWIIVSAVREPAPAWISDPSTASLPDREGR